MIWWILAAGALLILFSSVAKASTGDIVRVASNAGFIGTDLIIAVSIAYAESRGDPNAVGDKVLAPERGPSIGLWQINIGSKVHPEYSSYNLTDPQINANAAFIIYQQAGNSFKPWSTFKSGIYRAFMQQAQKEIQA